MKQLILLLMVAITFTACEDDLHSKVINLTVPANQWTLYKDEVDLNSYYSCSFDAPELTPAICASGSVQAYITFDDGKQQVLPYVRHYENSEGIMWTETYDFAFAEGVINVYVRYSDFEYINPPKANYRVVILY